MYFPIQFEFIFFVVFVSLICSASIGGFKDEPVDISTYVEPNDKTYNPDSDNSL